MTSRTTQTTATFLYPTRLRGIDSDLPPGSYIVETDEEMVPGLSFLAYRRVRTSIAIPGRSGGMRQVVDIQPDDLAAALTRDAFLAAKRATQV